MESLVIKKKSFWMRLYRFLFCLDKYENLPGNTCDLRKDLIIGSIIALICLPLVLVANIIKWFVGTSIQYQERYILIVIYCLTTLIGTAIASEALSSSTIFITWVADLVILGFSLVVITAFSIGVLISKINLRWLFPKSNKPKKAKKPSLIKELYTSAKDKYCKKITYI
jgi:uncharacterized membrane protein